MAELLDKKKKNKIYFISLLEGMLLGLPFTIFGILIPVMSDDLMISASYMGVILSINAFSSFIAVFVAGNLIELFGIKKVIVLSNIFLIIGMAMISFARENILLTVSYFITGFGSGGLAITLNSLVSSTSASKNQRSKRLLYLGVVMFVGAISGALITRAVLLLEKNWRFCFSGVGALFIIMLIAIIRLDLSEYKVKASYTVKNFFRMYKGVLLNPHLIIMGIIVFLHNGAIVIFVNWFTTYFKGFNIPVEVSALFLILFTVSEIAGLLLKIFLLKFLKESRIIIINAVFAIVCFMGLLFFDNVIIKILFIAGIGISVTGVFMLVTSMGLDINKKNSGIVLGYIYASAHIGSVVLLYISGLLIDRFSHLSILYTCLAGWLLLLIFAVMNSIFEKKAVNKLLV
ncbi:MAG: MFS transporter [Actinomycetia bacterium]|nr:MFS transporter [Actinomycetes bacterium]